MAAASPGSEPARKPYLIAVPHGHLVVIFSSRLLVIIQCSHWGSVLLLIKWAFGGGLWGMEYLG